MADRSLRDFARSLFDGVGCLLDIIGIVVILAFVLFLLER